MKPVTIGQRQVGPGCPIYVIAEAGKNHNGKVELARELVKAASESGVDAVKFQSIKTEDLMVRSGLRPAYFDDAVESKESEFDITKKLELPDPAHKPIAALARKMGLHFLSTPEDHGHVELLAKLKVPAFKVSSLNIDNYPLLRHIASMEKPMIISTGMATLGEVETALNTVYDAGCKKVILLQCTSNYPAKPADINLRAMVKMGETFDVPVGYSDHTMGISVSLAAVALGACLIEKHFTLSKTMDGPDHRLSAEPEEMKELVKQIRVVEKALGSSVKAPTKSELEMKSFKRRSIVATGKINKGAVIKEKDVAMKCPGTGLPAKYLDLVIGRKTKRILKEDTIITWEDLI